MYRSWPPSEGEPCRVTRISESANITYANTVTHRVRTLRTLNTCLVYLFHILGRCWNITIRPSIFFNQSKLPTKLVPLEIIESAYWAQSPKPWHCFRTPRILHSKLASFAQSSIIKENPFIVFSADVSEILCHKWYNQDEFSQFRC